MSPFIEIQQTWWHIEDLISPSKGRVIRQVMDLYTDQNFFDVSLGSEKFIGLKVIGRNINKELAYVENDGNITVNLGNMADWPPIPDSDSIKHVKLEIEYTAMNPDFSSIKCPPDKDGKLSNKCKIKNKFYTGYKTAFGIREEIQPEFYITIPRGMKMEEEEIKFYILLKEKTKEENEVYDTFKPGLVYVNRNDGKERYNIVVSRDDFDKIKQYSEEYQLELFGVEYKVKNDFKLILVPIFAFIVLFLSFLELISTNLVNIPYLTMITFIVLYLTLRQQEFEIHYKNAIFIVIIISLALLIIKLSLYGFYEYNYNLTVFNNGT